MGWLHRVPALDGAVPMLCPSYSGVPTGGQAQVWPTWGLRKAEPGQAGNGAAQRPRNREFQERRAEQWPPTCRWAYLDCAAQIFSIPVVDVMLPTQIRGNRGLVVRWNLSFLRRCIRTGPWTPTVSTRVRFPAVAIFKAWPRRT